MVSIFSLVRTAFSSSILNLKNTKNLKNISEELMAIAWHPKRWWDWCYPEDEKKEIERIFIDEL